MEEIENEKSLGRFSVLEALLRSPTSVLTQIKDSANTGIFFKLAALALGGVACYGLIVGSFSGGVQWWAAPLKLSAGLLLSGLMCFPSFYIFSCMSGAQARMLEILVLLLSALALAGILLVAMLPVTWIFTQASDSMEFMGVLHLAFWLIALLGLCSIVGKGLRHFKAHSSVLVGLWSLMFVLVTLQMTTTLRPIIGKNENFLPKSKKFFLTHWVQCLEGEIND